MLHILGTFFDVFSRIKSDKFFLLPSMKSDDKNVMAKVIK